MKIFEIITESARMSALDLWNYVRKLNIYDDGEEGTALRDWIAEYSDWGLIDVPLNSLHIPPSDDDPEPPLRTPYVQALKVDPLDAEDSANNVDRLPIIIDREGYILDGNHRAWAAKNLLNKTTIKAYMPV